MVDMSLGWVPPDYECNKSTHEFCRTMDYKRHNLPLSSFSGEGIYLMNSWGKRHAIYYSITVIVQMFLRELMCWHVGLSSA
jgi:hypothetical protein